MKIVRLALTMLIFSWSFSCAPKTETNPIAVAQRAAEQGDASAQFHLGRSYDTGDGIEHDSDKAEYWYHKAAEQGNVYAQTELAVLYKHTGGVKTDYTKAMYWFRKAAKQLEISAIQGDAVAQRLLGRAYHSGDGVEQNYVKAEYWYHKAAEQGNADAQMALGSNYRYGVGGVEQDYAKAEYWYRKAAEAEQEDFSARDILRIFYKEYANEIKSLQAKIDKCERDLNAALLEMARQAK